ncbi:hypothetical protein BT69DRAFT_1290219, partial [Atractiella rhizophila]
MRPYARIFNISRRHSSSFSLSYVDLGEAALHASPSTSRFEATLSKPLRRLIPLLSDDVHPQTLVSAINRALDEGSLSALPPENITRIINLVTPSYIPGEKFLNNRRFRRYEERIRAIRQSIAPQRLPVEAYTIILNACATFGFAQSAKSIFSRIATEYPGAISDHHVSAAIEAFVRDSEKHTHLRRDRAHVEPHKRAGAPSPAPAWVDSAVEVMSQSISDKARTVLQASLLRLVGMRDHYSVFQDTLKDFYNFDIAFPDEDPSLLSRSKMKPDKFLKLTGVDVVSILSTLASTGNKERLLAVFEAIRFPKRSQIQSGVLHQSIPCPEGGSVNPLLTAELYSIILDTYAHRVRRLRQGNVPSDTVARHYFHLAIQDHVSSHRLLESLLRHLGANDPVPDLINVTTDTRPSMLRFPPAAMMSYIHHVGHASRRSESLQPWDDLLYQTEILDHELKRERSWLTHWLTNRIWQDGEEGAKCLLESHYFQIVNAEIGVSTNLRRIRGRRRSKMLFLAWKDPAPFLEVDELLEHPALVGAQRNKEESLDTARLDSDAIMTEVQKSYDPSVVLSHLKDTYDHALFGQWRNWWQSLHRLLSSAEQPQTETEEPGKRVAVGDEERILS